MKSVANDKQVADLLTDWRRLKPRTLVDGVIDELIAAASRGVILPGDRIVEAEVASKLGVSRVPVREALRLLESQGLVVSEPYKGIRLREVTAERIDELIEARIALESKAARNAIESGFNEGQHIAALDQAIAEMEVMTARGDAYGHAKCDTAFHRAMVHLGSNSVIADLWETLARQMTIIFGLSTLGKSMSTIVDEHRALIKVFRKGDAQAMAQALDEHISVQTHAVDFDAIVARRRVERSAARSAST